MPRTRFDKKKNQELGILLSGYIHFDGGSVSKASEKTGMSRQTLSSRLSKPGDFTIDELLYLCRQYHVPIEDLRAAIRY